MTTNPLPLMGHPPNTRDAQGRLLCTSLKHGKVPCNGPAIRGLESCVTHIGVGAEEYREMARVRIAHLTAAALDVQSEALTDPDVPWAVRVKVAKDILDLSGAAAASKHEVTVTDLSSAQARAEELIALQREIEGGGTGG